MAGLSQMAKEVWANERMEGGNLFSISEERDCSEMALETRWGCPGTASPGP
jgi:hypothetical protein